MACRSYFCPTYRGLKPPFKTIVRELCDDWYLFGLIITETRLLNAFFREIEIRSNHPLAFENILDHPQRRSAVSSLLQLKIDWPFRTTQTYHPCHYFFEDQQYRRSRIAYDQLGCSPSRHDVILHELDSQFESIDALRQAEKMLDEILDLFATSSANSI
jgi:hypothetical protein